MAKDACSFSRGPGFSSEHLHKTQPLNSRQSSGVQIGCLWALQALSFMCSYPPVHTRAYSEFKIKNDFKGCHATYSFVKENKYNVNEILDSAVNCWKYKEYHFKKTNFI